MDEKDFLDSLVKEYPSSKQSSQVRLMRNLIIRICKPYIKGGIALELGCEYGYMSELAAPLFDKFVIVDGSKQFLDITKQRNIPNAEYKHCLFEEIDIRAESNTYDYIFASHILEHVQEPQKVLNIVYSILKPGGYFFVFVPNATAASRQLAKHMGLLNSLYEFTPADDKGGHRRVYDIPSLAKEIESSGLTIVTHGGLYFKPFADFQMDLLMDQGIIGTPQIEGLYRMGFEYPNMCADVYAVAKKGGK